MSAMIAVDWGSSSFRAALLDASGQVQSQVITDRGGNVLQATDFEPYLHAQLEPWRRAEGELPVVLCGMVGSSIGWQEVPYLRAPLAISRLPEHLVPVTSGALKAWIVPGVMGRSLLGEPDVMRGEETQLLGWLSRHQSPNRAETIVCLPGTHTKWAHLNGGELQHFSTAYTGELYALLTSQGVLVRGPQRYDEHAFYQGLGRSAQGEALNHTLFAARSRVLAGVLAPELASAYLSGLIVGADVVGYRSHLPPGARVQIIGGPQVGAAYKAAMDYHQVPCDLHDGTALAFAGLFRAAQKLNPRLCHANG
ncbi:2-dehydro-3-deoxygalactonokinase [Marinimicrobium alkaliphilum]|uniref:2-dehydro-3-deoxygalactonokinase n=1 Tax=Marinimicrobium alkaliphilum TaxID=2202654 RepID=UPI000DB9C738|nr:2-dehydro-3-deoxygalactonokinase [Marinimicrobium alkaliphilum]